MGKNRQGRATETALRVVVTRHCGIWHPFCFFGSRMKVTPKQVDAIFGYDTGAKPQANQAPVNSPRETVDELNLLFSGVRSSRQNAVEFPQEPISIPEIDGGLQGIMQIGKSPATLDRAIENYKLLKKNLLERRKNLSITLEGYVQPHEALDLFSRIDAIDEALLKIGQNLDKAVAKKGILEAKQKEQNRAVRLEQDRKLREMRADREAQAHLDYKVYEENGENEEGVTTETLRQA